MKNYSEYNKAVKRACLSTTDENGKVTKRCNIPWTKNYGEYEEAAKPFEVELNTLQVVAGIRGQGGFLRFTSLLHPQDSRTLDSPDSQPSLGSIIHLFSTIKNSLLQGFLLCPSLPGPRRIRRAPAEEVPKFTPPNKLQAQSSIFYCSNIRWNGKCKTGYSCNGKSYSNQEDANLADGDGAFNDSISSYSCRRK
ncbi:hypothetical protein ACJZ2D_014950 [Fusarium nematophilum]